MAFGQQLLPPKPPNLRHQILIWLIRLIWCCTREAVPKLPKEDVLSAGPSGSEQPEGVEKPHRPVMARLTLLMILLIVVLGEATNPAKCVFKTW